MKYVPLFVWIFTVLVIGCMFFELNSKKYRPVTCDNQFMNIEVGKKYLHSYNWEPRNPFEEVEIDTIMVLDKKGAYVKYAFYLNGSKYFETVQEEWFFKDKAREIKNK